MSTITSGAVPLRRPSRSPAIAAEEPLWTGQICPDHPHYRRNVMPGRENWDCKNCWRILLGYPARMHTDLFTETTEE